MNSEKQQGSQVMSLNRIYFATFCFLLLPGTAAIAQEDTECDAGVEICQRQHQKQTFDTLIPPDFVDPYPGLPIPPGYLSKQAKKPQAFNDVPGNGMFKVQWNVGGKAILMVPEENPHPYFYSQRRVGMTNYSWFRLKGLTSRPYKHVGDFTVFGAKEGFFSEPSTIQEIQQHAAETVTEIDDFGDQVLLVLSIEVQPQSVSGGFMPAGSAADSSAQVVGGVGAGKSSNHLTSRAVATAHVFKPLLGDELLAIAAAPRPSGWIAQFEFDSAELSLDSIRILDEAVSFLKANPDIPVDVAGHTCSIGPDTYNYGLSNRRARSVVDYLVSHGISAQNVTPHGYGETQPLNENETPQCREANRRAEILLR